VVAPPLATHGGEPYASMRGRRFATQLRGRFGLQVVLVHERGSSMEAQEMLGKHVADDSVAAMVILRRYLDALTLPEESERE
jgi:putative Holliday junction resolvase